MGFEQSFSIVSALVKNFQALVNQMITTKKQLQQAKTESNKDYLQRKCDSIDKQIDQLIYQLYGLTEEEIRIVEGEC